MDSDSKDIGIITDQVAETTCSKCGCKIDVAGLDPFMAVECPDCGSIENVPAKLGQFLLLNMIGKGGMGGVYYAEDTALGRHVAIKVMLQTLGDNKEFVETFKREAQAVAKLNHPNIVQIYAFGKEKGQPYIVMELVSGQRLDKMMEGGRQVDQALVMKIAVDVADALKAADEIGLVHGDIKPENILLDEKGSAKLVDFGLATFAHQGAAEGIWGTPYYIAPEKIKRQPVDARSDIYSLGATLYHALTGKPPFEGKTPIDVVKARLEHDPVEPSVLRPKIDRTVEGIVMRMLQRQPVRRFPNYSSLLGDLRKVLLVLGPVKTGTFASQKAKQTLIIPKKRTSAINVDLISDDKPAPKSTKIHMPPPDDGSSSIAGDSYSRRLMQAVSKPKKDKIKIPKWVYLVGIAGLLIWGMTSAVLKSKRNKQKEREYKIENLNKIKERTGAEQIFAAIQLSGTSITKMSVASLAYADKVTNAVFIVTGEQIFKPAPKMKEPVAAAEEPKTGADTNTVSGTATGAVTNAVAAASATNDQAAAVAGPPGEATKEELENARGAGKKTTKNTVAAAPKAKAPPKPAPAPVVAEPEIPANEPEVRTLARKIFTNVDKLAEKAATAKSTEEAAQTIRDEALSAKTSLIAGSKHRELATQLEALHAMETEARELLTECDKIALKAEAIRVLAEEDAKVKKKAIDDEAKKKADEEAAQRKSQELKTLIESEKKLVEAARKNCTSMIKAFDFKGASDSVNSQAATFQTDEGKAAIKILVDRYAYLMKLKLFLVERLNIEHFQWGWLSPSQDIIGADLFGVKIKTKTISWPEINGTQLLRIIDHCLADKNVPYKIKAENALAAAILCYELSGMEAARKYANQSTNFSVSMKEQVARLLSLEE